MKVAFIGLGVMGFPIAGHLSGAGHTVTVYNRTRARTEAWLARYTGRAASTPQAAAQGAEIVFACVGNDNDVRQIATGPDGAFGGMSAGAIFIDHSTVSARVTRELAQLAGETNLHFLDAPVSGGQVGAEKGVLTVMVGGPSAAFTIAQPVVSAYARAVTLMGPVGCGQLTKMVNQIAIAAAVEGIAEGLNFAMRAGLDAKKVIEVIANGAAQSWQLENRGPTMVEDRYDFGFAVDWMRKDLQICLDEARFNRASLPVTALLEQLYGKLQALGYGRLDSSQLDEASKGMSAPPVTPVPAATVALVRDADGGFEVLMMQRNLKSQFVPGAHVFPGGVLDPGDSAPEIQALAGDASDTAASAILGIRCGGLAYWIAAIREAFEESGLLLARDSAGRLLQLGIEAQVARFREHRHALNQAQSGLDHILLSEGLTLAIDELVYFAHWITPIHSPRRYDARFFVAKAPPQQVALHDDYEMTAHAWITPGAALERHRSGDFLLRTPTVRILEEFATYSYVDDLMAAMRHKGAIPTILPTRGADGKLSIAPLEKHAK